MKTLSLIKQKKPNSVNAILIAYLEELNGYLKKYDDLLSPSINDIVVKHRKEMLKYIFMVMKCNSERFKGVRANGEKANS